MRDMVLQKNTFAFCRKSIKWIEFSSLSGEWRRWHWQGSYSGGRRFSTLNLFQCSLAVAAGCSGLDTRNKYSTTVKYDWLEYHWTLMGLLRLIPRQILWSSMATVDDTSNRTTIAFRAFIGRSVCGCVSVVDDRRRINFSHLKVLWHIIFPKQFNSK